MIAACDINGFAVETCEIIQREQGANDPDETQGTVDRERFQMRVEGKLLPVLGKIFLRKQVHCYHGQRFHSPLR